MNSIYRMELPLESCQLVPLTGPPISALASRNQQNASFDLWYEHMDDQDAHRDYEIHLILTGASVPWTTIYERAEFQFLGTFIAQDGFHVGHVYSRRAS